MANRGMRRWRRTQSRGFALRVLGCVILGLASRALASDDWTGRYIFDWNTIDNSTPHPASASEIIPGPQVGRYHEPGDSTYTTAYTSIAPQGFPILIMLAGECGPIHGAPKSPFDPNSWDKRSSLATALGFVPQYMSQVNFVISDFEPPLNPDNNSYNWAYSDNDTQAVIGLVRSSGNANIRNAYIGNYNDYPGRIDNGTTYSYNADRGDNSTGIEKGRDTYYRNSGLNIAMPVCYPYSCYIYHANPGGNWYGYIAPNPRSALFWAPLEHFSAARRSLPCGHLIIPWVAGYVNTGVATDPYVCPPKADLQASIKHYRLRGADGYYTFAYTCPVLMPPDNHTYYVDNSTNYGSDTSYRNGMLDAWKSLDAFFASPSDNNATTYLNAADNFSTDKCSGINWSGAQRGNGSDPTFGHRSRVLISNLDNATSRRATFPSGYGLPPQSDPVAPNTHVVSLYPACMAWRGGNTDASWDNVSNWSGGLIPIADEPVFFGYAYSSGTTSSATIASGTNAACSSLYLGYGSSSSGTVSIRNGGSLTTGSLILGEYAGDSGTIFDHGAFSASTVAIGTRGSGLFDQFGGTSSAGTYFIIGEDNGSTGTYNLREGTVNTPIIHIGYNDNSTGTFNQSGGTLTVNSLNLGTYGGQGTYNLTGGTLVVTTDVTLGNGSRPNCFIMDNTTVTHSMITDNGTTASLHVLRGPAASVFRGNGAVNLHGMLYLDGQIIADGLGNETTLDLSSLAGVSNLTPNPGNSGYFAQNKGKLVLPIIKITANGIYNWGESSTNPPDLINSFQMTVSNMNGDNITAALLDPNRSDVPNGYTLISVWNLARTGSGGGSFAITFRYNDNATLPNGKTESNLQLYHYTGGSWSAVPATLDSSTHRITAGNLTDFGLYAVGITGTPATVQGKIKLNDFNGPLAGTTATTEIRNPGAAIPLETHTVVLDTFGNYALTTCLSGTFDITAKASHWLRAKKVGFAMGPGTNLLSFRLTNGDCDGDNQVAAGDLYRIMAALDTMPGNPNWDSMADLDGDGGVTATDLSIVLANMDLVGDQ